MVFRLLEDQMGAISCGQDVVSKVDGIDGLPNVNCRISGLIDRKVCVAMEIRGFVLKYGLLKCQESIDIPLAYIRFIRIDKDREIEEVRNECTGRKSSTAVAGLQDIQALDDDDVGLLNDLHFAGNDVIGFVRVHRN